MEKHVLKNSHTGAKSPILSKTCQSIKIWILSVWIQIEYCPRVVTNGLIMVLLFHLQGLACLRCCWSISICGKRLLFASIVPQWLGSLGECTYALAFQDRLCLQRSNDWKEKKNVINSVLLCLLHSQWYKITQKVS